MDSAYYIEYYELERNHWWFRARSEVLESQIKRIANGNKLKILNIGTATGAGSEMLSRYGEVTSVEFDSECVKFLRGNLKMEVTEASILELPYTENEFDLVCAFDVIEHVEEDQLAAQEMLRVCKNKGTIFCTVPAYNFLWSKHDEVNHHKRRYTASTFNHLFVGSKIIYSGYFNTLLFLPVTFIRISSRFIPRLFLRKGAGSDFTLAGNQRLNSLLYYFFRLENNLLRRRIRFPFGISYLLITKKNA